MLKFSSFCFIALIFVSCNVATPPKPPPPPVYPPINPPDPPPPIIGTFQSVWDDFKCKSPKLAATFDVASIEKFRTTNVLGINDLCKHLEYNAELWKAIGLTDQEIARIKIFKKKIVDEKMPNILFSETSTSGIYFFDLIPTEGGIRKEFFYWYSKQFPNEWRAGLKKLNDNLIHSNEKESGTSNTSE